MSPISNGLSFLTNRRLSNGNKTDHPNDTAQGSAPATEKGASQRQSRTYLSKASGATIATEKVMDNSA